MTNISMTDGGVTDGGMTDGGMTDGSMTDDSMTDDSMTIRQMCDRFEVTARTLRFYESKELLSPMRTGQKRLFSRRDRARLKLILQGKRFGFSLEEIRQLLDLYDIGDGQKTQFRRTYDAARQHLHNMEQQYAELGRAIEDLHGQLKWVADHINSAGPHPPADTADAAAQ